MMKRRPVVVSTSEGKPPPCDITRTMALTLSMHDCPRSAKKSGLLAEGGGSGSMRLADPVGEGTRVCSGSTVRVPRARCRRLKYAKERTYHCSAANGRSVPEGDQPPGRSAQFSLTLPA